MTASSPHLLFAGCAMAVLLASPPMAAAAGPSRPEPAARRTTVAKAVPQAKLAAVMPEQIGDWKRVKLGNPLTGSPHDVTPAMQAQYARGNERADVELIDFGKAGAIAFRTVQGEAPTPAASGTADRIVESKGRRVRLTQQDGHGSASIVFANGYSVRAHGRAPVAPSALQAIVEGLDLAAVEALRAPLR